MAINTEIKDIMNKKGVLFEVAEKVEYTDPIVRARLGLSPLN